MRTDCGECPLRQHKIFVPFSAEELSFMRRFKTGELEVEAGATILLEGSSSPQLFTVLEGMGLRYKTFEDGRRQVLNFLFPGDFIGLQATVMGHMTHSVEMITQTRLCVFNRSDLWTVFKNHPERSFDLTWLSAVEEHFLGETIASLGQRNASERLAWALVRVYERLMALSLCTEDGAPFPFRQQHLADALGLSLVHTNKTLARFKEKGWLSWRSGKLDVTNLEALKNAAMYDGPPERRPLM